MKVITIKDDKMEVKDFTKLSLEEIEQKCRFYEGKYRISFEVWEELTIGNSKETSEEMMDWLEWSALVEERDRRLVK